MTEVYIPAKEGMIGILPEHAPLLSELGIGELTHVASSGRRKMFVAGGWVPATSTMQSESSPTVPRMLRRSIPPAPKRL